MKKKFKKYTAKERKELGLDKVPDTMYAERLLHQDLHTHFKEEPKEYFDPRKRK